MSSELSDLHTPPDAAFTIELENFSGPFDLLLRLIARHSLDITEVALSRVTDEFIARIRSAGDEWDLEQTSSFMVVAATLLDLKAARLLPRGEVEDPEDLALLEARDLLFARLLQYRAYRRVANWLAQIWESQGQRFPRPGGLEPHFAALLPEITIPLTPIEFAALATRALTPSEPPTVSLSHLHAPMVSVRDEAVIMVSRLRRHGKQSFRTLVSDSPDLLTTVCRFLAILELFREGVLGFDQLAPLGELTLRWIGDTGSEVVISDEFDPPQIAEEVKP